MKKIIALVDLEQRGWQWAVLLFLAFIWGSSFILMKKGLVAFSGLQLATLRMFFGFLFLAPFALKFLARIRAKKLKSLLIVGFIGNALPAVLFALAQTRINSSLAGMLNATVPLFTLIIGVLFYHSKVQWINVMGILIALIGAMFLMFNDLSSMSSGINAFALLILLATISYGVSTNEIKNNLSELSGLEVASLALFLVGPFAGAYLLFSDFSLALKSPEFYSSLTAIVVLSLFSTAIAVVIFNYLIKYTSAIFAASVTYVIPFFALIWGILDGEKILPQQLIGMFVVLMGIYWVNKRTEKIK